MKTYTLFLDAIIVSLLVMAVQFKLSNNLITDAGIGRGIVRTMVISWQSLMVVSSFCLLLRYIARNIA